jgi:hypothetical protein
MGLSISFHSLPRLVLGLAASLFLTEMGAKANIHTNGLWIDAIEIREQPEPGGHVVTLKGSLPNPCHSLGWEVGEEAFEGVLHIQAWAVDPPEQVMCLQVIEPFSVEIPLGSKTFESVAVNGLMPADLTNPKDLVEVGLAPIYPEDGLDPIPGSRPQPKPYFRSDTSAISTPGPLPLAAALAGWHTARRLRRRCKGG